MENIDQNFELLQRYIDGDLAADQRAQVEARLEQEPDFAQLYQRSQMAIQVIREDAEQSTMAFLDNLHEQEIDKTPNKKETGKIRKLPLRRILSIAAVLILLLTAGIWLFLPKEESLTAFEDYYDTPAFDMQRGGTTDALLSEITTAYNNGDFTTTLEKIAAYENIEGPNVSLDIYQAVAYLELGQTQEALNTLEPLTQQSEQLDEIYWLQAMAHLRAKNKAAAIEDLQRLLSDDFSVTMARRTKVQALLEELTN